MAHKKLVTFGLIRLSPSMMFLLPPSARTTLLLLGLSYLRIGKNKTNINPIDTIVHHFSISAVAGHPTWRSFSMCPSVVEFCPLSAKESALTTLNLFNSDFSEAKF
jgi:hypothetical protein